MANACAMPDWGIAGGVAVVSKESPALGLTATQPQEPLKINLLKEKPPAFDELRDAYIVVPDKREMAQEIMLAHTGGFFREVVTWRNYLSVFESPTSEVEWLVMLTSGGAERNRVSPHGSMRLGFQLLLGLEKLDYALSLERASGMIAVGDYDAFDVYLSSPIHLVGSGGKYLSKDAIAMRAALDALDIEFEFKGHMSDLKSNTRGRVLL